MTKNEHPNSFIGKTHKKKSMLCVTNFLVVVTLIGLLYMLHFLDITMMCLHRFL